MTREEAEQFYRVLRAWQVIPKKAVLHVAGHAITDPQKRRKKRSSVHLSKSTDSRSEG